MGQKTNPTIFRLGKTKSWESKYIEKKNNETSVYTFKDLEIKKFISKFFDRNGLMLHSCKIYYSETTVHLFISYYLTQKYIQLLRNIKKQQQFNISPRIQEYKRTRNFKRKYYGIKRKIVKYFRYSKLLHNNKVKEFINSNNLKKSLQASWTKKNRAKISKNKRLIFVQYYKQLLNNKKLRTKSFKETLQNSFLEKFNENISIFTNKSLNVSVNFKQLNKDTKKDFSKKKLKDLKKNIAQLRKFNKTKFFKEGLSIIYLSLLHNKSAEFFSKFIANELRKQKRHKFFLDFLQQSLSLLNKNEFCNTKNIRIKVKGRLNGVPRSKCRYIKIGSEIPIIKLNSDIDYAESTAFSSNGTFGVKVWIHKN